MSLVAKILLVEDENNLGATLKDYLESQGHEVDWANSYQKAKEFITNTKYNIALLDIGLPDGDGISLAIEIKTLSPETAFMFLSAQNDPDLKVKGLDIGAQDYMTKPFNLKELSFRLKKILSYYEQTSRDQEVTIGPLKIWFNRYQATRADGSLIDLGTKECEILKLLFEAHPNVVSRDDIISKAWGEDATTSYRTVDNYIVTLRKWAESDKDRHLLITSVRGIGYKLEIND